MNTNTIVWKSLSLTLTCLCLFVTSPIAVNILMNGVSDPLTLRALRPIFTFYGEHMQFGIVLPVMLIICWLGASLKWLYSWDDDRIAARKALESKSETHVSHEEERTSVNPVVTPLPIPIRRRVNARRTTARRASGHPVLRLVHSR